MFPQNILEFHNHDHQMLLGSVESSAREGTSISVTKHFRVLERQLSYRFYPHFHPYVGELVSRLIKKSVPGLQAADTDYEGILQGSIRISIAESTQVSIPAGTQVFLLEDLQVTLIGGATATLSKNMRLTPIVDVGASLLNETNAYLLDVIESIPFTGEPLDLDSDMKAEILRNTLISFINPVQVELIDGEQVTIPGGTQVTILRNSQVILSSNTIANFESSKPKPKLYERIFTDQQYNPSGLVQHPYPVKELDFSPGGAYSAYNWELFYHVPITIGIHLSKNQRFEDAMHWFHYIFDPTDNSDGPTPERFWKVKPFQYTDVKKIEEILVNLSTGNDPQLQQETISSINALKEAPFRPHVVARYRQTAYMFKAVMAYLDNLTAWGDALFRQDTIESINEATQLYVLAANILGPRPQAVPKKSSVRYQTYANLKKDLNEFGNALVQFESDIPFDILPYPADASDLGQFSILSSIGRALYFCVPRNDKILSYWDTVADRLFKIHNSLNIQGIFRQLPLFEPPIDPAMLARAAAAGLDISAIVNGLNQPLPLVRFQLLVQKAAEICQEVKSLGNNLLSAIEKEENEALAILRAKHERLVMELVEHVKYGQLQEAIKAKDGLLDSLALAVQRYTYYEQQLGKKTDEIEKAIPELGELDKDSLLKMRFKMDEPEITLREIDVDIAQDLGESGGKVISSHESQDMTNLKEARDKQETAAGYDKIAGAIAILPNFGAHIQPLGPGSSITFGGSNISAAMNFKSTKYKTDAEKLTYEASKTSKIGSYSRREQDWAFQSNLAAGEISQIFKQLRAAQIREAMAGQELKNHQQQIRHAEEIEYFLTGEKNPEWTQKIEPNEKKIANKAFYTWMKREVKGLYAQCFQFAFDIAKKAERALQHEVGNPDLSYVRFGYLDGKEGLLAGEKLYMDLKRMEIAFHELNQREYELTKHVSLMQVDPLALLEMRATGRCTVRLPEALFDMDGSAYFRRIKSVALSIPCVAGPYASVNCRLTLLKSSIRKSPVIGEGYARTDAEDPRFSDYFGSMQSIVTSSAQNDSGMFETNLRDERYLPFEGSGVISEWRLELPANPSDEDPRQFDYDTISDVILHIRYTAREGGELLRNGAKENLTTLINEAQAAGSVRLFSVRHEFPTEWAKFKSIKIDNTTTTVDLTLNLREEHYPFWSKERLGIVKGIDIYAKTNESGVSVIYDAGNAKNSVTLDNNVGKLWTGKLENSNEAPLPAPTGEFTLNFDYNSMSDLWLAVTWGN